MSATDSATREMCRLFIGKAERALTTADRKFSKHIHRLFENRQLADYDVENFLDETVAREDVAVARTLVAAIQNYLHQEAVLPS